MLWRMVSFHSIFMTNISLNICPTFFIHLFVSGYLGCFHVLATVNSAAMNNEVHLSFQIRVFSAYVPGSDIAESYDNCTFSLLKNFHTVFLEKAVATHSSTLAWKTHGQRSLVGCSPWGR